MLKDTEYDITDYENYILPVSYHKSGQYFVDCTGHYDGRFDGEEMQLVFEGKEQNSWEFKVR